MAGRLRQGGWGAAAANECERTNMKLTMTSLLGVTLIASGLVAGCGAEKFVRLGFWTNEPTEQQSPRLVGATQYTCDGNKRLAVRFAAAGQPAMVIFPEREFRLDPVKEAAGRYTNGRSTLVVEGESASLDEGGTPVLANCKRVVAQK